MWRLWSLCLLGWGLAGCAVDSSSLPRNGAPIAAACIWSITEEDARTYFRRAIDTLEAQEFRIVDTNLPLGLINAQRQRVLVGYSSAESGGWGIGGAVGWFGSRGGGIGLGVGRGGFGGYAADPLREERLTLLIVDSTVRLSRNSRIIEADGWVRNSRDAASEDFCRELRRDIEAATVQEEHS